MSASVESLLKIRVPEVQFLYDIWHWSPGIAWLLDVDKVGGPYALWRIIARENGETWAKRRDEAMRAIRMKARRQKHPLIRTTLYVTLPTRRGGLLEQPVHVVAVADAQGVFHVWLLEEDRLTPATNTARAPIAS